MKNYKQLYTKGFSNTDIKAIITALSSENESLTWEDYYWGAKCICASDSDDFDPLLFSRILNKALKFGLSYTVDRESYLDAMKMLAITYSLQAQYDLVLNCLGSILDLDSKAPDWVYHEFVAAQNQTKAIKRNLRNPEIFFEDLAHNDDNSEATRKKQANIFLEFLTSGILFLSKNPDAKVAFDRIKTEAEKYGVENSEEWRIFEEASKGSISKKVQQRIERVVVHDDQTNASGRARPLVISLFPDVDKVSHEDEGEAKTTDLLEKPHITQKDLDRKNKEIDRKSKELAQKSNELENAEATIAKLSKDIDKYKSDITCYKQEIASKENEIEQAKAQSKSPLSEKGIRGKISSYVLSETTECLARWLKRNLAYRSNNWWNVYVMEKLKPEQQLRAQSRHYKDLSDLDLSELLRVLTKNLFILKKSKSVNINPSFEECIKQMWELRNNYAHQNSKPLSKDRMLNDLAVILEFLSFLRCDTKTLEEIANFANEVGRTEF